MPCFHLYPRIIRNAEYRVETGRIGARIRFSRKRKGEKRGERLVQHRIGPSPPHHSVTGLEERRPREDGPKGGQPRRTQTPGVAAPPVAPTWPDLLPPTAINVVRMVRARVH
jgi:hypothetical protein